MLIICIESIRRQACWQLDVITCESNSLTCSFRWSPTQSSLAEVDSGIADSILDTEESTSSNNVFTQVRACLTLPTAKKYINRFRVE